MLSSYTRQHPLCACKSLWRPKKNPCDLSTQFVTILPFEHLCLFCSLRCKTLLDDRVCVQKQTNKQQLSPPPLTPTQKNNKNTNKNNNNNNKNDTEFELACSKPHALVYDILPTTTGIVNYDILPTTTAIVSYDVLPTTNAIVSYDILLTTTAVVGYNILPTTDAIVSYEYFLQPLPSLVTTAFLQPML